MKKRITLWMTLMLLCIPFLCLGEIQVSVDRDTCAVGEFLHIEIERPENAQSITYTMTQNGKAYFETEDATRFSGEFCPRRAGTYVLKVKVRNSDRTSDTGSCTFTVTEETVNPDRTDGISPAMRFDQKDGWWKGVPYSTSTLNRSGCAIFTLSHALARLGYTDPEILPPALAARYGKCYVKGGTSNPLLINTAAGHFGFLTRNDAIESPEQIRLLLRDGSLFTFSIVIGHIALIDELSEDGNYVHIVDSAPQATLERIKDGFMYLRDEEGNYSPISDLANIPGMRWYPDTDSWSSLEYWMDLSYVAQRSVRMIMPMWLTYTDAQGMSVPVDPVTLGAENCTVRLRDNTKVTVPTSALSVKGEPLALVKVVSKKGNAQLTDPEGNKLAKVKPGTVLPVINASDRQIEVRYQNLHAFLPAENGEILSQN